ncbi:MAG TPA: DsbA family protein [Aliidongia sp.]|nr:DsbA family protein [Aliidongia sp.]
MRVEFVFDYRSPYAYLASNQLKKLGVEIEWKPVDILPVMKLVNNQPSPACPPKSRYALLDAGRWAKHYQVDLAPNMALLQAMREGRIDSAILPRAGLAALELGVFDQVHDALFAAVWAGTDDLVSEAGREAFLERRNLSGNALWRRAADPALLARMEGRVKECADRGVFGVPTMFVGDEMFFGNDRLSFVQARVAEGAAA